MTTKLLNNRYRVIETIGNGGFGETFLAIDTHMPSGRKCVIKKLKSIITATEPGVQDRFRQEAAILEELGQGHDQIPQLYAYFTEGDKFYLVQEWIPGITLQAKVEQGVLSPEQVKTILLDLLPVLEYVHSRHIIHRDIKPENIIIRAKDNKPILIDFGAVKQAMATVVQNTNSSPSVAIGTPGYMSSEQAAGRPVYSSDLYSLGLTAVYLLTGKNPQDLMSDQDGEILWRETIPHLHSNLATVIDRSIRFHPRDRFSSAKEMLTALDSSQHNLNTNTVIATPQNSSSKSKRTSNSQQTVATMTLNQSGAESDGKERLKLLLPFLVIGGVVLAGVALSVTLWSPKKESQPIVTSPSPVETPKSEPTKPEIAIDINEYLQPHTKPLPQTYAKALPLIPIPEEREPSSPNHKPLPPSLTEPSQPSPTPPLETPISNVAIFPLGVSENEVEAALGEPISKRNGRKKNSILWSYPYSQGEIVYVFNKRELRKTEVYFDDSVDLSVIKEALDEMFGGNAPQPIQAALNQVYERDTDLRSFRLDNIQGMIQRNQRDQIYISIWDSDF